MTKNNEDWLDSLLLDLVHDVSSIRAGKTFTPTDYTNPAKQAIKAHIAQELEQAVLVAKSELLDALENHKKTLDYIVIDHAPKNQTNYEVYLRKAIEVDSKIATLQTKLEQVKGKR